MSKKRLLIFHQALAPYRVDQFNFLNKIFDLKVVFFFDNHLSHNFDQKSLRDKLSCQYSFLLKGPHFSGHRVFRYGMLNAIRDYNPDIIIGYEYSFTTQYLILLKKLGMLDQQIGTMVDDSMEMCKNVQSNVRNFAREFAVNRLDFMVVLSEEVARYYQEKFKLAEHQLIISPILQKPERLRKEKSKLEKIAHGYKSQYNLDGKKVLLYVGRFAPEKGLLRFIQTIRPLIEDQENLIFIFVGNGPEQEKIEEYIEGQKLNEKFIFPGRFKGNGLYAWYLCASGFFLPSTFEPFGAVVNEALIFGLKTFCSKYAGSSTIITTEENGIVFDPLNSKETIMSFRTFLASISLLDSIKLKENPSQIDFDEGTYSQEWMKVHSLQSSF